MRTYKSPTTKANKLQLRIRKQSGEALVHVVLVMTVEERWARVVGYEVDLRRRVSGHADRVLHQPRSGFVPYFCDLKGMAMCVHRMLVATVVVHHQSVALALLNGEQRISFGP